jgi:hypothetical protein
MIGTAVLLAWNTEAINNKRSKNTEAKLSAKILGSMLLHDLASRGRFQACFLLPQRSTASMFLVVNVTQEGILAFLVAQISRVLKQCYNSLGVEFTEMSESCPTEICQLPFDQGLI